MANDLILESFVSKLTPSDRLLIKSATGEILYKGFAANFIYSGIDPGRKIKRFGLGANVYKVSKKVVGKWETQELGEEVPIESISRYGFSDLEMMIWTRVILEG